MRTWLYGSLGGVCSIVLSATGVVAFELAQSLNPSTIPPQSVDPPISSPLDNPQVPPRQPEDLSEPDIQKNKAADPESQPVNENCPDSVYVEEFKFVGNTVIDAEDLTARLNMHFKQKNDRLFSCSELIQAATVVSGLYKEKGYETSGAIVRICPASSKENDSPGIFIEIIEGKLEKITVLSEGSNRLDEYVKSRLRVRESQSQVSQFNCLAPNAFRDKDGKPLNIKPLQEALQLLQLDPLIQTLSAELSDGATTGQSILEVTYKPTRRFNPLLFVDNGRSPSVGSIERGVVLRQASLLRSGDGLSVGYTNSDGSNSLEVTYQVPYSSSNGTIAFTFFQGFNEVIEPPFDVLDIDSSSRFFELSLRQSVLRSVKNRRFEEVALGFTGFWRESESSLLNTPFPLTAGAEIDGSTRVFALRFSQDWTRRDIKNVFAVRSEFSLGLNALDSTINQQFSGVAEIPDSEFFSWRGQAQWGRFIDDDFVLILRVNSQLANALLPSEQFSIGGFGSVRGYRQDQVLTDNGIFASAEVQVPIFRTSRSLDKSVLHVAPFIDFGAGWNSGQGRVDPESNLLASVGLGLQFRLRDQLTVRLDWGWPLIDVNSTDRTLQESGFLFSVQWRPKI